MITLLHWNDVTLNMIIFLILIGVIHHHIVFNVINNLPHDMQKTVNDIQYKCLYKCDKNICKNITNARDDDYYVDKKENRKLQNCIFTMWELSHLLVHVIIGYYYNIYISVIISISFEIYEHYKFNCGSYLDLIWNLMGFIIGHNLRIINNI